VVTRLRARASNGRICRLIFLVHHSMVHEHVADARLNRTANRALTGGSATVDPYLEPAPSIYRSSRSIGATVESVVDLPPSDDEEPRKPSPSRGGQADQPPGIPHSGTVPPDEAGEQRDHLAEHRDQASALGDAIGTRRDRAGDQRDQVGAGRDAAGHRRDRAGQRRDEVADLRDDTADDRDRAADQRDQAADQRDQDADDRDQADDRFTVPLHERITALALYRSELTRAEAASDRDSALRDRQAAASERAQAGRDRDTALGDREAGAEERTLASSDRVSARADRQAGADERSRAEGDRDTASADRDAAAKDRVDASMDGLTELYRRDTGMVELTREMARMRRTKEAFVLAFLDVDNLKAVNDSAGHAAGDQILVDVAHALRSTLRPYDLVIRYGGDEFICAAAGVGRADLALRISLANDGLVSGPRPASVSAGFAFMQIDDTAETLIARADADLYQARVTAERPRTVTR
jgi:diguanylate cyclase (GGDEF)-like protein